MEMHFCTMPGSPSYVKQQALVLICCLLSFISDADTLILTRVPAHPAQLSLRPFLTGWEDTTSKSNIAGILQDPSRFSPLHSLSYKRPTSVYWLRTTISTDSSLEPEWILHFSHLTNVEVFLYQQERRICHRLTGAFRPRSQINDGDSRFHVRLPLQRDQTYTLLLRVHHTKGYRPFFNFSISEERFFVRDILHRQKVDAWLQGAIGIFFLYTLLSWLVSRYRPYCWLLLFIGGAGMYGICSGPYFTDWFFPEAPATGWLFNGPFLHLGLLGFYLLVTDFWNLPEQNPVVHRFGQVCITVLLLVSVSGFCINYFTGNFRLANTISLWAFVFTFSFVLTLLVSCFRRLNRAQRYLYYGIVLFLAGALYVTLSSAFVQEQALLTAPYVSNATILAVFLIFATGLKEALRQHEKDKLAVLDELTRYQQHQNILLENKVADRTRSLRRSNQQLRKQKALLVERNATIETLMNDLNHRVKNNLQLLYSLSSLQLPGVEDEKTRAILKGNTARIRAMMLVNQKLDYSRERCEVKLALLVGELTGHLQEIYDRSKSVYIRQNIPEDIRLPSRCVLSLGLILTELLTNTFKYAFPGPEDPCIFITATLVDSHHLQLVYADNGKGFSPGSQKTSSMGLSLVKDLARQLNGTLSFNGKQGTAYTLIIPVS